ncbi:MAG: hypothetical protein ACK4M7_05660, partial [Burkholderiales bacterium]
IFSSLMFVWSCWPLTGQATVVVLIGIPIYLYYNAKLAGWVNSVRDIKDGFWLLIYVTFMVIISYLSPFGGKHILSSALSQTLVVMVATCFYFIAVNKGFITNKLKQHIRQLEEGK